MTPDTALTAVSRPAAHRHTGEDSQKVAHAAAAGADVAARSCPLLVVDIVFGAREANLHVGLGTDLA